jgi:hypothetical protein
MDWDRNKSSCVHGNEFSSYMEGGVFGKYLGYCCDSKDCSPQSQLVRMCTAAGELQPVTVPTAEK